MIKKESFYILESNEKVTPEMTHVIGYPQHAHPNLQSFISIEKDFDALKKLYPKQPNYLYAVTGTDGKTSTVFFFYQILEALGINSGIIGTFVMPHTFSCDLSSWHPIYGLERLEHFYNHNIQHVAFEAWACSIDFYKYHAFNVQGGVFTNLSHEHLDFFKTIENYFAAKKRLFTEIIPLHKRKIINTDCPYGRSLLNDFSNVWSYGHDSHNDLFYDQKDLVVFQHRYPLKNLQFDMPCFYANLLAAIGLIIDIGIDITRIFSVLHLLKLPLGRLNHIYKNNIDIIIDFAHTPKALQELFTYLKPKFKRIIHILGEDGLKKDQEKRKKLGTVAAQYADVVIITDLNPKHENPRNIRKEILQGCPNALEIPNRISAIKEGFKMAQPGDVLLCTGRGHENVFITGRQKHYFTDHEIIKEVL